MRFMVPFLVACVATFLPRAAVAADNLGLSPDGVTWSPNLTTPLFDPAFRWIPGDTETSSFWVRNQSSDNATLDVSILGSGVDSLMQTGDLAVTVRAAHGSGSTTTTTARHELITSRVVNPGQTERIDVTVAFDPASGNQSQAKALDLRFEVRLTQDVSGIRGNQRVSDDSDDSDDDEGDDNGHDRNGALPGTGGPVWWLLPAGLIGIAAGGLTVALSRRRDRSEVADV